MKWLILLLSCAAIVISVLSEDTNSSEEEFGEQENCNSSNGTKYVDQWLEVPLDHFNLFDNRTWNMRYLTNDEFFKENGPLFIEVGGEWTIDGCAITTGQLPKLAKKHKGMLVETEHRYYGKSLPFSTDFTTENLKYLQIEQALEDLAYFIEYFKEVNPRFENSKVIIHGCSYPGMLVTWLRLRFPHVVDIAYASSAPLGVGLEYPEYFEVINDVYANVSSNCINTIREAFNTTAKLLKTPEGSKTVRDALRNWDCGDVDDMESDRILFKMLNLLNVQSDPHELEDVACLVMSMDTDDLDPFHRFANYIILKSNRITDCADNTDPNPIDVRNGLAWNYQMCTEQGTFTTLYRSNSRHPFELDHNVEETVQECANDFDGLVTEKVLKAGIERVTRRYGGKKPKVTKVLTIQGSSDPWKHLAELEDYNSEAPVWVIKGSHCVDVQETQNHPTLIEIRTKIRDQISKWIEEIS